MESLAIPTVPTRLALGSWFWAFEEDPRALVWTALSPGTWILPGYLVSSPNKEAPSTSTPLAGTKSQAIASTKMDEYKDPRPMLITICPALQVHLSHSGKPL